MHISKQKPESDRDFMAVRDQHENPKGKPKVDPNLAQRRVSID